LEVHPELLDREAAIFPVSILSVVQSGSQVVDEVLVELLDEVLVELLDEVLSATVLLVPGKVL
jgi:hypothetical protein